MTIHCWVRAFLSADTSRDLVTNFGDHRLRGFWGAGGQIYPFPIDCHLLTLNCCLTWRVTLPTLPPSLKTLRLFVHELRVITVPIDYHWKCVCGQCACAESCYPWVWVKKQLHIWNPWPRFAYSLYNFYWATTTIQGRLLSSRPMLKPFSFRAKKF